MYKGASHVHVHINNFFLLVVCSVKNPCGQRYSASRLSEEERFFKNQLHLPSGTSFIVSANFSPFVSANE
jgi:hypothetical protein